MTLRNAARCRPQPHIELTVVRCSSLRVCTLATGWDESVSDVCFDGQRNVGWAVRRGLRRAVYLSSQGQHAGMHPSINMLTPDLLLACAWTMSCFTHSEHLSTYRCSPFMEHATAHHKREQVHTCTHAHTHAHADRLFSFVRARAPQVASRRPWPCELEHARQWPSCANVGARPRHLRDCAEGVYLPSRRGSRRDGVGHIPVA